MIVNNVSIQAKGGGEGTKWRTYDLGNKDVREFKGNPMEVCQM